MLLDPTLIATVPEPFHPQLSRFAILFNDRATDQQQTQLSEILKHTPALHKQLLRAFVGSEFIATSCCGEPSLLLDLLASGELMQVFTQEQYATQLAEFIGTAANEQALDEQVLDEEVLDSALRHYRCRAMVRFIWRDLNRLSSLEETTAGLSALADASVQQALDFHYRAAIDKWGKPIGRYTGSQQPMVVLGMGKLGAGELNISSDIDLVFTYPESGETQGARKTLSNQEFFHRLGQKVIKSLDTTTEQGFVFRIDMRLRPYGQSGALVSNYDALENYYQTQGREWERYAMIKARVIAVSQIADRRSGEKVADKDAPAQQLMALLRPFTYRKYIDYSAIDAMRSMKSLINREVKRTGANDDVKLGAGGIREVEFVVQVFQLIRGGRDPRLQERGLLNLLPLLEEEHYLPQGVSQPLAKAYRFLRNTEHAIQAYQDRQTQTLPSEALDRQRLAWVMGFEHWRAFVERLGEHRRLVNSEFQAVVAEPDINEQDDQIVQWQELWQGGLNQQQALSLLQSHQCSEPQRFLDLLTQLRASHSLAAMQALGRERLELFMPRLLLALEGNTEAAETLNRILPLVRAVARRSIYIVLLIENPRALSQLVKLCAASPWIADQLSKHPALLDELLDSRTLYAPPDKEALRNELRRDVLRLAADDLEGHMEVLRYFRMAYTLRVAASEVTDVLPLMKVSDYLTYIAEVVLEHVLALAWQLMTEKHGYPNGNGSHTRHQAHSNPDFIIIGYGKLGGIELGHGSDLDLVFLHDADATQYTDGGKSIDNQTFYTRLGQKIIHILNTQTVSGQLYDVDMRLRPSGNSGLLVSSLKGFAKYQREQAWTWEHQALVRARVVVGCAQLAASFEQLRKNVLCQQRPLHSLRNDVKAMREKMREHLGSKGKAAQFNVKQDPGGVVDIEFMVQYAVLAWAHQEVALVRFTDNIRILSCLEQAGLLQTQEVSQLIDAYKAYRSMGHRLALQRRESVLSGSQFIAERQNVERVWQRLLGDQA